MDFNNLRKYIRKVLLESAVTEMDSDMMFEFDVDGDMMDEERITNPEAKEFVKRRENFIASHCFGEDLGDLGLMYVAYSYGTQFPAYIWYKDKWYRNMSDYINSDGSVNEFTKEHLRDMEPTHDTHGLANSHMQEMIRRFMKKYDVKEIEHLSVEPGVKN